LKTGARSIRRVKGCSFSPARAAWPDPLAQGDRLNWHRPRRAEGPAPALSARLRLTGPANSRSARAWRST
jgi:hypothetical protein